MKKQINLQRAARKMAKLHAEEMALCARYEEACKQANDKVGENDFSRLVREHAAAWYRYCNMAVYDYKCNLNSVCSLKF